MKKILLLLLLLLSTFSLGYCTPDKFKNYAKPGTLENVLACLLQGCFLPAGVLDTSFGNGLGFVTHHSAAGGGLRDHGHSIMTDWSNRIVVFGISQDSVPNWKPVLWRYDSSGTLDNTFGGNGYLVGLATLNNPTDEFRVLKNYSGKIIAIGNSYNGSNYDMSVWRIQDDGNPDVSFNNSGFLTHSNAAGGNGDDYGFDAVVDFSQKITIAGSSINAAANDDIAVWRVLPNGTLDTTFNQTGVFTISDLAGPGLADQVTGIVIDRKNRILISGKSGTKAAVLRLNQDGTLDKSFNNTGYVLLGDFWGFVGSSNALTLLNVNEGKILVAGYSEYATGFYDAFIAKINEDGSLDNTFNGSGIYRINSSMSGWNSSAIGAIEHDVFGNILATGYLLDSTPTFHLMVARLHPDGFNDEKFGDGSCGFKGCSRFLTGVYGKTMSVGLKLTQDFFGKILITGFSKTTATDEDMTIWRYR